MNVYEQNHQSGFSIVSVGNESKASLYSNLLTLTSKPEKNYS